MHNTFTTKETYIFIQHVFWHVSRFLSLTNIKPRFSIYPTYTHHFSCTRCVFPVAATCWSLLAWRRHPFVAVVFPVVFPALCPPWCSFCSASGSCAPGVGLFLRVALASHSSPQPWPAPALTWPACWRFCSSPLCFPSLVFTCWSLFLFFPACVRPHSSWWLCLCRHSDQCTHYFSFPSLVLLLLCPCFGKPKGPRAS